MATPVPPQRASPPAQPTGVRSWTASRSDDVRAAVEQPPHRVEPAADDRPVQRRQSVRAAVDARAALDQPRHRLEPAAVRRERERLVEHLLRVVARRRGRRPADVGEVRAVRERLGPQRAAVEPARERVEPAGRGRDVQRVGHERDRREQVGRLRRAVVDGRLQRRDAPDRRRRRVRRPRRAAAGRARARLKHAARLSGPSSELPRSISSSTTRGSTPSSVSR